MVWNQRNSPDQQTPPLFVTAYSHGKRYEDLLEAGRVGPRWFKGELSLQIDTPGGASVHAELEAATPKSSYEQCLDFVGGNSAWLQELEPHEHANLDFELWSSSNVKINERGNWLHIVDEFENDFDRKREASPMFVAVVRNPDGTVVHGRTGRFLSLDVRENVFDDHLFIPKAIVDTGLAGAFWGFAYQNNRPASNRVAKRLLSETFGDGKQSRDLIALVAAAHAVLAHRDLLDAYGEQVINGLSHLPSNLPDVQFLLTLLRLVTIARNPHDHDEITDEIRESISVLAHDRPVFGETLRWLDAKLSVLVDIIRQRKARDDSSFEANVGLVREMMSHAFVGGQVAVYLGEPPAEQIDGALAQKKILAR
ncbi:hypothetical protein [Rhizobium leguminosarum]